jgi:hypothetical protein
VQNEFSNYISPWKSGYHSEKLITILIVEMHWNVSTEWTSTSKLLIYASNTFSSVGSNESFKTV